jgi:hypothetical protein
MIGLVLLVLALVLFLVAMFNVPFRLNLVAAGLAAYVASQLFGHLPLR